MLPFIEALGQQTAGKAIDAGMGLILGGINDKRQIKQQQKLQDMQIAGQKQMTDYNTAKQLQMWKDTNYSAQMEQLAKAGLNPGLIYGMSGGGGSTTSISTGNVSGASAPTGGREVQDMIGSGLQYALIDAQRKNIEADTKQKEAETTKTAGVDTTESQTRTDALLQGIDNARQEYEIKRLEITMKNIENFEKQASQEDRLDYIEYQAKIAAKNLQIIANEQKLSDATLQQKIEIIRQETIGAGIKNELMRSGIAVNTTQINLWIQQNMREWDKMTQENKKIHIEEMFKDFNTDPVNRATENISHMIDNIIFMTTPKPIHQGTTINNIIPKK